jgi:hypothetical protein
MSEASASEPARSESQLPDAAVQYPISADGPVKDPAT